MKSEYPKCLFHRELPMRTVHNPVQHEALGAGWEESPAAFVDEPEDSLNAGTESVLPAGRAADRNLAAEKGKGKSKGKSKE